MAVKLKSTALLYTKETTMVTKGIMRTGIMVTMVAMVGVVLDIVTVVVIMSGSLTSITTCMVFLGLIIQVMAIAICVVSICEAHC